MNNKILPKALTEETQSVPKEDEYIHPETGLIYCKKCNTARQKHFRVMNQDFTPYMMCECQRKAFEQHEAERKKREFWDDVERKRSVGLHDRSLYYCTFANDLGYNPKIEKAREYAEHFTQMKEKGIGLLLWGSVGTGKTFIAGCIANALLDKGIPVMMTTFGRILNKLTGTFQDDKNIFIDSLNRYDLLILDDLGMERNTEFALEQVFDVIDTRYRSKKPLIVTTNLSLKELKNPMDLAHNRIYDRVLEMCVPVQIDVQNIRFLKRDAKKKEAEKLLSGVQSENSTNSIETDYSIV